MYYLANILLLLLTLLTIGSFSAQATEIHALLSKPDKLIKSRYLAYLNRANNAYQKGQIREDDLLLFYCMQGFDSNTSSQLAAVEFATSIMHWYRQHKYPDRAAKIALCKATKLYQLGNSELALTTLAQIDHSVQLPESTIARAEMLSAEIYSYRGDFYSAIETLDYIYNQLTIPTEIKIDTLIILGNTLRRSGDNQLALFYLQKAKSYADKLDNYPIDIRLYLAYLHSQTREYNKVITELSDFIDEKRQSQQTHSQEYANAIIFLTSAYLKTNRVIQAESLLPDLLNYHNFNLDNQSHALIVLANYHAKTGASELALSYLSNARVGFSHLGNNRGIALVDHYLYDVYSDLEEWQLAAGYLESYIKTMKELNNSQTKKWYIDTLRRLTAAENSKPSGVVKTAVIGPGYGLLSLLGFIALTSSVCILFYKWRRAQRIAHTDALTDIPNRLSIIKYASDRLSSAHQKSGNISLAILDIDHFKQVNDTYGHDVGDKVLIFFADFLTSYSREPVKIGRIGGEEFLLIMPDVDSITAVNFVDNIREQLQLAVIPGLEYELQISFSAGVCTHCRAFCPTINIEHLIKNADEALYQAKHNGRNRVFNYDWFLSDAG